MGYGRVELPTGTRFLVTGSAGFIGSNLVEALLGLGHKVCGLDNYSTGKKENVEELLSNPLYEFIEGDIRDFNVCREACQNIDYVLHQAALGSVPRSMIYPLIYEDNNVKGTSNIMEAARLAGVKRVIYASSSSVYGDSLKLPKAEGDEGNVLSPYALTKKVNEQYGALYTHVYGLECIGLRYFNVFGRRQDPNGAYAAVIPKFLKQLLNNETPIINGDGRQSRDFTYIDNVIEANIKACLAPSEAAGQAFNIAYGSREYLIDIYYDLCRALDRQVNPIFGPDRAGDIKHSNANISNAKQLLGYEPDYDFAKGTVLAIEWYKNNL
ncbi:NAD-dependent epimerase/dehydratase family protein [Sporomusa malonica]|uniref:UDP-N-acetylglucosamine 4-epimerase n=1 Tax=Sporomusa malonica TaxID=112901 RepID=A0A1W2DKU7_9FIRM|nr:NAD-dependent epimerase/dehydratase family protein [Sporomusa malonica]SMC98023.1 UDP-N-acetylglucosamine 4-epimerase [Sporomusa malonica]